MTISIEGLPMLRGTLDDFDLRHVFRFLSLARKTGKLSVVGPVGGGKVFFRAGDVYHAESDLSREGFGRKLVNAGKLTEQRLKLTLEYCASTGKGLGEALVENGFISRGDLDSALHDEIEEVVLGLFRNETGHFTFETDEQVDADTVTLVRVESLIKDDSDTLRKRVPALNSAFVKASISAGNDMEISISSEEWSVIALIDGRRSVGEIATRLSVDEHSVMRSLRRLLTVGLVTLSGGPPRPAPKSPLREPSPAPPRPRRAPPPPPPPPPPPGIPELRDEERLWSRERP